MHRNHTGGTGTLTSDTGTARGLDLITGTVGFLKGPRDGTLVTGPSDPAAGYALLLLSCFGGIAISYSGLQAQKHALVLKVRSRPPRGTLPASRLLPIPRRSHRATGLALRGLAAATRLVPKG